MSTGLTIEKAIYGAGSSTVDVTSAVSKKVKDGVLSFTVSPTSLGIDDPAPGQLKQVEIDYTINNGSKNSLTKKDNDLVSIDAPPARVAAGLQIVKGEYGYPGNWTDVTNALQDLMSSNGSIDVKVGFKALGLPDPNPNKKKELKVEYTLNGASSTEIIQDGERFRVSAPPLEDNSGRTSPTSHVFSLLGALVYGFFTFLFTLLQLLSGHASARIAEYWFGPSDVFWYIFFGLGIIIPLFGFIGFPIIIFIVRLIRSTNVIPA